MTKGRQYHPTSANEGSWFRPRGQYGEAEDRTRDMTSTRAMLEAPFSAISNHRTVPVIYNQREKPCYRTSNPFSAHDNRHCIQGQAEYLGNGCDSRYFGRRLHAVDDRLHKTDVAFLYHEPNSEHNYSPTTFTTYKNPGLIEPLTRRRFPKVYGNAESSLPTKTLDWCQAPSRTPLHVLAMSQQPLLPHNTWKYSSHGDYRVYPPYNRKKSQFLRNILNIYSPKIDNVPGHDEMNNS